MSDRRLSKALAIQSPSEIYHEASKLESHDSLLRTIFSVNNNPEIRKIISKPSTSYRGFSILALPKKFDRLNRGLTQAFLGRKSSRAFSGIAMPLTDLAAILYFGAAVTREIEDEFGVKWGFRCAPSGGALYPLDIYCVVSKVASVEAGLYAYDASVHSLQLLKQFDFTDRLIEATFAPESLKTASFSILMVANFARSKFKYGERAYRFVFLEAGHIAQNILLATSSLGHSAFPIGGYLDDVLNDLIGIDGCDQAVVYGVVAGCAEEANRDP